MRRERADDIGLHYGRDRCAGDTINGAAIADDFGIVDERSHTPEIAVDGFEEAHDVVLIANISLHGDGASAFRLDLGDDRSGLA